jgi:hypothetical protein
MSQAMEMLRRWLRALLGRQTDADRRRTADRRSGADRRAREGSPPGEAERRRAERRSGRDRRDEPR